MFIKLSLFMLFVFVFCKSSYSKSTTENSQLIVDLKKEFTNIKPNVINNIVTTKLNTLDELNVKYGCFRMEKVYRGPAAPAKGLFVLNFPTNAEMNAIINDYVKDPHIKSVERNDLLKIANTPNDYYFSSQWAHNATHLQSELAWNITTGSPDIIIAINDTGVDYLHPDLIDNIWVNPGEDLDGDGVVGDFGDQTHGGDEDGIDNDGNGYVDDLIGWDFKNNDNNPQHSSSYSHGTLMAGLASASTNNVIGVSGISWHSKLMATKVGEYQGISLTKAIAGIYYAADNGCGIINMSWYGGADDSLLKNALNYAFLTKNVVLTAAAGNENDSLKNYPAAYSNVISVAALTESDTKRWNSCFGTWIDISAPANLLWTTDYQNGLHTYFNAAGATSGASAETAGLAALIKSANPLLNSSEVKSIIINTTDNIDASNPSYVGLLGSGRINAYSALVEAITPAVPGNFAGSWDNGDPETGHPKRA